MAMFLPWLLCRQMLFYIVKRRNKILKLVDDEFYFCSCALLSAKFLAVLSFTKQYLHWLYLLHSKFHGTACAA